MPLDPSNLPPELLKALSTMVQEQNAFVGGLHQQATDAQGASDSSFQQLLSAAQQPAAQMDPHQEFVGRLLGNLSQAIAPSMNGQQQAEQVLAERKHVLQQQQMQRLQLLSQHHDELSKRATAAGDTETAAKQAALAFKHGKTLDAMNTVFSENMANQRADRGNAAQVMAAQIAADAHIQASGQSAKLPPDLAVLDRTFAENQDAANTRIAQLDKMGSKAPRGRMQQEKRSVAESQYARQQVAQLALHGGSAPKGWKPEPLVIGLAATEIQDLLHAKPSATLKEALALIDGAPGNDETWHFADRGIGKRELKAVLTQMWPKDGPPGEASTPTGFSPAAIKARRAEHIRRVKSNISGVQHAAVSTFRDLLGQALPPGAVLPPPK